MKKNVFLSILVAVVLSTGLFAEGKKPGFVDLGVSYHFFGETGLVETPSGNKESILAQNSFSIDFSVKGFFNEEGKVGIGTVVNLFFPQSMTTIIAGYASIKLTDRDFDSALGLSLLVVILVFEGVLFIELDTLWDCLIVFEEEPVDITYISTKSYNWNMVNSVASCRDIEWSPTVMIERYWLNILVLVSPFWAATL